MELIKINLQFVLKDIHAAKNCIDVSDCEIALEKLNQAMRLYPQYHKSISKKIDSIERKMIIIKHLNKTGALRSKI